MNYTVFGELNFPLIMDLGLDLAEPASGKLIQTSSKWGICLNAIVLTQMIHFNDFWNKRYFYCGLSSNIYHWDQWYHYTSRISRGSRRNVTALFYYTFSQNIISISSLHGCGFQTEDDAAPPDNNPQSVLDYHWLTDWLSLLTNGHIRVWCIVLQNN